MLGPKAALRPRVLYAPSLHAGHTGLLAISQSKQAYCCLSIFPSGPLCLECFLLVDWLTSPHRLLQIFLKCPFWRRLPLTILNCHTGHLIPGLPISSTLSCCFQYQTFHGMYLFTIFIIYYASLLPAFPHPADYKLLKCGALPWFFIMRSQSKSDAWHIVNVK